MKKKSLALRLGILALALTLITTSLSSGTLARYTESVSGKAEFQVAAWNVGATIWQTGKTAKYGTLDSAKPATLTDLISVTGTNTGVVANKKLAPGANGSFVISIDPSKIENIPTDVGFTATVYINPKTSTGLRDDDGVLWETPPTNFKMTAGTGPDAKAVSLSSGLVTLCTVIMPAGKTDDYDLPVSWSWGVTDVTSHDSSQNTTDTSDGTLWAGFYYDDADASSNGTANANTKVGFDIQVVFEQVPLTYSAITAPVISYPST